MAGKYGNFQNPFYVDPLLDIGAGLRGLSAGLDAVGMRKAKEEKEAAAIAKEEQRRKATATAIEAYKTNDPDKIAMAILQNPEIGETLGELYDKRRDYDKEDYVSNLESILTEIETTGGLAQKPAAVAGPMDVPAPGPSPMGTGLPGLGTTPPITGRNGKMAGKADVIKSVIQKDPKKGKQMLEYEFAKNDPKRYKAWRDIYRPEEKGTGPSAIKKKLDERQALLDSGLAEDDPKVKAYDEALWPGQADSKPTAYTRLINEQAEFLAGGGDPNSDVGKGFQSRILGAAAEKSYGPSAMKKLIRDRQNQAEELRQQGMSEDEISEHPWIKAYDNNIAGVDIDIEEMTQEEIDMLGQLFNLTGKMPSMGRGKTATKYRLAVLKSAARQAYEAYGLSNPDAKNITPMQAALNTIGMSSDTKAIQGSLNYLDKQVSSMGSFIQNMDSQIDQVGGLMKDLPLVDTRLMNVPIRFLHKKIVGNPKLARYELYLAEIEREISKLSNASTASIAAMSVEEIRVWSAIHDKNLSTKDMWELLQETRHAAQMRMDSVTDQMDRTRKRMRTRDYSKIAGPGSDANLPTVRSKAEGGQADFDALESGDRYRGADGRVYTKP